MIDRIGNFRVIEELGRGGFGIVYGAVDDDLDRTVAIKLLTAPISAVGPDQDNLVREARLLAEMNHPYIATVYHLGFHQDQPYIVMEFVPDGLTDRMGSGGRLSAGEAVRIAGQVCEGLAYAHKRGVIHRDIKPQNILISEGGDVKIVDFGLARGANVDSLFSEGEFGGTPHYSAPEQFENDNVNAQADVYAVGILLYQMLSGQLPFQSDTLMTLYDKHKKGIPVPPFPADLDLPEWLQNIVERAVAKDRQQRYQSAGEMLADIEDGIELELAGGAATEPCPTSCQPPPPPSPRYARTSSIVVKAVREAVQQANRSRWGRMTTILTILSLIVGIGILSLRFSSLWSEVGLFEERGADNSPAVSDMTAPEAPAAPVGGMTLQQLTKATPRIPETSPAPTPEALRIQSAVEMLQQPEATVGKTFYSEPVQILINPDDGGLLTSVEKDVAVEAPPGAVSEPMTLSYRRLDPDRVPVLPSGYSHTGRVFDIAVSGGSALTAVGFSFRSPVKIIVALSAETQAMVARAEAGIVLMHFSNSQWLELETFRYAEHPAVFANIGSIGTFAAAKSLR